MKTVKTSSKREWVLQGYLAVNPSSPQWSDLDVPSVYGWQKYFHWKNGKLVRDPRLTKHIAWSFVSAEAAREVLEELLEMGQEKWLRVVERQVVETVAVVAGHDIVDGEVVKNPDGSAPEFMGEHVPGCRQDLPTLVASA